MQLVQLHRNLNLPAELMPFLDESCLLKLAFQEVLSSNLAVHLQENLEDQLVAQELEDVVLGSSDEMPDLVLQDSG